MSPRNCLAATLLLATLPILGACDKTDGRQAQSGDVVTIHFTGKTMDGKVFETTQGDKPRQVHIGANFILPALEQALIGMREGERKRFSVKAEQAYGPRIEDETMIQVNYRANQPHPLDYSVGQKLDANIQYPDGTKAKREVTVIAVDDKTFTVDANHPLAGKDLSFDVELVTIQ
jgi:peptidylprolyl isomerase